MGGRLILIRVMLSFIHIYQMSVCVFPDGVKQKLCGLFSQFLWVGNMNKSKLYLVN